ncbi:hypothetical protein HYV80_00255 [Candidatus Woesearchaeota archaeon]|nr:hypothetical protein [Candidatus Woesearchaeota archaeon]
MVSFQNVFELARLLNSIEHLVYDIKRDTHFLLIQAILPGGSYIQYAKELLIELEPKVNKINKKIKHFNKIRNEYFEFIRCKDLSTINFYFLKSIILKHNDFTTNGRKLAVLERDKVFQPLEISINSFFESFRYVVEVFGGSRRKWNTRAKCHDVIRELMELYSFGFFESTVLLCGCFLEELVTDYLKLLKNKKLIKYKFEEINKWDFETKINILYKENKITKITEGQKSKLLSIKWDRNICAHPATKKEREQIRNEVDAIIISTLNIMQEIESKIQYL